jgi:hypothetical protein
MLLLLGTSALLGACRNGEAPPPPTPAVLVQPAAALAAEGSIYTGEIRARHEVDLSFRVGGKIAARLVDAGAEIKAGSPWPASTRPTCNWLPAAPAPSWRLPKANWPPPAPSANAMPACSPKSSSARRPSIPKPRPQQRPGPP